MSKDLTIYNLLETQKPVTRPIWLLFLGCATPKHFCSRETLSYDGFTWLSRGLSVTGLKNKISNKSARLTINDTDNVFTQLILSTDISDIKCQVIRLYGDGPWATSDGVVLFDGVLDGANSPKGSPNIIFSLLRSNSEVSFAPRTVLGPPFANHLAPVNSIFTWQGERVVVTE